MITKSMATAMLFLFTLPLVVKWFFAGNLLDKRERSGIISVPIVLVQLKRKNVKKREHFPARKRLYIYG